MADNSEKTEPKSSKKELPGPFLLEVTPEELVMPSTENLEVKIRNPTASKCKVLVYFDSFFWLMKINGKDFNINRGSSNSMCFGSVMLWPESSFILSIGYHDAKYKEKGQFERCHEDCPPLDCETHHQRTVDVPPSKRNNYSYERPEGVLIIKYHLKVDTEDCSEGGSVLGFHLGEPDKCDPNKHPIKRMDLHLKDETEEYKKYREQFLEIRKEQERKARWGHVLVNEDGVTKKKFRDLDGTIRGFKWENDWEYDIPTDLKQFDALSDERILKIRKEKKQIFDDELKKKQDEKEEEEVMKKKKKEKEEAAAAKEKSEVKTVEKSRRPEEPPQKVPTPPKQNSTRSKVSVAPPKEDFPPKNENPVEKADEKKDRKLVEKPNATKNKKKKTNPCCTLM
ncbi:unnamed protein product [Caenorhabditis brenneri]